MQLWVVAAVALLVASARAESDPTLLARGAEALRMVQWRQDKRAREHGRRPASASELAPRVYKGTLADAGMFPYAAYAAIFGRACSSTVIHPFFVLLSKWCTENRPEDGIIMAGGTEFTTVEDLKPIEVQIRQIKSWWIHEWHHDIWHDIAIARIFSPFIFGKFVGTLTLPDQDTWGDVKLNCILMGFGEAVVGDRQHLLHFVNLRMRNYRPCQEGASAYGIPIGENAFCSIDTAKASMCEGDGGGPVICRGQLYGINSDKIPKGPKLIRECGETVLGNYFMYLGYYKSWITATIRNNTPRMQLGTERSVPCHDCDKGGTDIHTACSLLLTAPLILLLSLHK